MRKHHARYKLEVGRIEEYATAAAAAAAAAGCIYFNEHERIVHIYRHTPSPTSSIYAVFCARRLAQCVCTLHKHQLINGDVENEALNVITLLYKIAISNHHMK